MGFGKSSESLGDRLRQYGVATFFRQVLRRVVRSFYSKVDMDVYGIPGFTGMVLPAADLKEFNLVRLESAVTGGEIDENSAVRMREFLNAGYIGLYIEIDGEIAGTGWIQYGGPYQFGPFAAMDIPEGVAVMKNLYVRPKFRGRKLGLHINQGRLAWIKPDIVPVTILLRENRYAVRNWKKLGLVKLLSVEQTRSVLSGRTIQCDTAGHPEIAETLQSRITVTSDGEK